jgi:hypothetical protein
MLIEKKMTNEEVCEAREAAHRGTPDDLLGARYGVSAAYIAALRQGHARKTAGGPITKKTRGTTVGRIARLEREVALLREEVTALRDALDQGVC